MPVKMWSGTFGAAPYEGAKSSFKQSSDSVKKSGESAEKKAQAVWGDYRLRSGSAAEALMRRTRPSDLFRLKGSFMVLEIEEVVCTCRYAEHLRGAYRCVRAVVKQSALTGTALSLKPSDRSTPAITYPNRAQ